MNEKNKLAFFAQAEINVQCRTADVLSLYNLLHTKFLSLHFYDSH